MPSPLLLVHGGQHGGWCWRRVAERTRQRGVATFTPTLTGLGERRHLLSPSVRLDTHVADVVGVIEAEELDDVVLVGHSAATTVIAGATAALGADARKRLRRLVYFDGVVVVDGESSASSHPVGRTFDARRANLDGVDVIPAGDGTTLGLDGADLEWARRRLTAHPLAALVDPVRLPGGWDDGIAHSYVWCTRGAIDDNDPRLQAIRADSAWDYHQLDAGHDAMISHPDELADILVDLCGGRTA